MSEVPASPPPPPPPRKSRTGLIIGIVAAVAVLCICCVVIGVVGYIERDNIPGLSSLFATPTPEGIYYSNASMQISLYYPLSWIYDDSSDGLVIFATSRQVIDASDFPASGAGAVVLRDPTYISNSGMDIGSGSPEDILNALVAPGESFVGYSDTELESMRSFTLVGYPAASTAYLLNDAGDAVLVGYFVVVVPDGPPLVFIGICPQSEWDQHRPTFDNILASVDFQTQP